MLTILLAIAIGLVIILLTKGRVSSLLNIQFRYLWAIFGAVGIQVFLEMWSPTDDAEANLAANLFVASFALVVAFCLGNLPIKGMGIMAIGAFLNASVIMLNQGMPVRISENASQSQIQRIESSATHHLEETTDSLKILDDRIVLPSPFNQSISFGDILLMIGLVELMYFGSRRTREAQAIQQTADATPPGGVSVPAAPMRHHDDPAWYMRDEDINTAAPIGGAAAPPPSPAVSAVFDQAATPTGEIAGQPTPVEEHSMSSFAPQSPAPSELPQAPVLRDPFAATRSAAVETDSRGTDTPPFGAPHGGTSHGATTDSEAPVPRSTSDESPDTTSPAPGVPGLAADGTASAEDDAVRDDDAVPDDDALRDDA